MRSTPKSVHGLLCLVLLSADAGHYVRRSSETTRIIILGTIIKWLATGAFQSNRHLEMRIRSVCLANVLFLAVGSSIYNCMLMCAGIICVAQRSVKSRYFSNWFITCVQSRGSCGQYCELRSFAVVEFMLIFRVCLLEWPMKSLAHVRWVGDQDIWEELSDPLLQVLLPTPRSHMSPSMRRPLLRHRTSPPRNEMDVLSTDQLHLPVVFRTFRSFLPRK